MTKQEIYNQIVEYFSRPDAELCRNEQGKCFYRHPVKDLKCAFGVVIPDELYNENTMETIGAGEVIFRHPELQEYLGIAYETEEYYKIAGFCDEIQEIHDTSDNVEGFLRDLRDFMLTSGEVINE